MLKRFLKSVFIIAFSMLFLTGCIQVDQVNLTEEEQDAIVSYVADLLLKYDKNHQSNLVDTTNARELEARVKAMKEFNALHPNGSGDSKSDSGDSTSDANGESVSSKQYSQQGNQDIAQALKLAGFSVEYSGMEVCKSYVGNDTGAGFALEAGNGKQLMVYHFNVTNETSQEADCDTLAVFPSFKLIYNGSEARTAMTTFLDNDFSSIEKTVPAGESIDAVICVEVAEGYEGSVNSTSLMMNYIGEQSIIPIN